MKANFLEFMKLLPAQYHEETRAGWLTVHKMIDGLPLTDEERAFAVEELTGGAPTPTDAVAEFWALLGRREGKSFNCALKVAHRSTCIEYDLSPGEVGVSMLVCPNRRQAGVTFGYVSGILNSTPVLKQLIRRETTTEIELTNGIVIEVHTARYKAVRGFTVVTAVLDECAFFDHEEGANPDIEILAAIRPAMATVPDALLMCVSSAYAEAGAMYEAHQQYYGKPIDDVLYIKAPTRTLNPTVDQKLIDRALKADEARARAEYFSVFRTDVQSFITRDAVDAVIMTDRREILPRDGVEYHGFIDMAGGSGQDSATLAIAHSEELNGAEIAVLDLVAEFKPPFSPEQACARFAETLKRYRINYPRADRFSGDFAKEALARYDIWVEPSERTKSQLYMDLLPLVNSGAVMLLDNDRLKSQLLGLERRVARGGRESIDHRRGQHDDLANAAAGALHLAALAPKSVWGGWDEFAETPATEWDRTSPYPWKRYQSLKRQRLEFGRFVQQQRQETEDYGNLMTGMWFPGNDDE